MTKINTILFVCALPIISGCVQSSAIPSSSGTTPPDIESIVSIFQQGLDTNKENNPNLHDAEAFGAALISIAWEQLAANPDAASEMRSAFEEFVKQSNESVRYYQWGIFLENLETALLQSKDAEHLQKNWDVRKDVIELQTTALQGWIQHNVKELNVYANELKQLEDLATIKAFDGQTDIEFLLELFESEEIEAAVKEPLTQKINEIAQIIDGKLLQLEQEIEVEQKKDLPDSDVDIDPEKSGEQKGKYQELLEQLLPHIALQDKPDISFWSTNSTEAKTAAVEGTAESFSQRLVIACQKAQRLQIVRYNLWASRMLSHDSTIDDLSQIDTDLLDSSVSILYSQKENELITQQPEWVEDNIRTILLPNKVPLEAF